MPAPRLYDDLAHLWPLISPPEDYAPEAAIIRELIADRLGKRDESAGHDRPTLLELGAGGGHTLYHLTDDYDCVAVDLSEPMLSLCRQLNPGVETVVGDMRSVRLDRTFDAVLIHDAIDYMTSEADVLATLETVAAHLKPGGLALIAPTYVAETFIEHETEADHNADESLGLTFYSYVHQLAESDTQFEMILLYLIKQPAEGGPVTVHEDRHRCGLFAEHTWLELMQQAGFAEPDVQHDEHPWTLFIGVKPQATNPGGTA